MLATLPRQLEVTSPKGLHLERTNIVFANASPEWVSIEVTVANRGRRPTAPAQALLQAAPLGAFVPWRPLTTVAVPALEPGESFTARTRARQVRRALLGSPDRLAPRQLLTALDEDDRRPLPPGTLPLDLMEIIGRGGVHWAGNLNVFIGQVEVERHMAQALRVYPGRVNVAMFVVGSRRDEYAFHLAGEGAHWDAALYDFRGRDRLSRVVDGSPPVEEDRWIDLECRSLMALALSPPQVCTKGSVEVHVTQRSTKKAAIVEFSLDPAAAGPGCYVV